MNKILLAILILFLIPATAYARIGVGVATGKIEVTEKLKPGVIYQLPPLTVVNTGDETLDYEASIEYHQDQKEMLPPREWFSFSPRKFNLEPGDTQPVKITLNLPINAKPGDYFAFLEGHPLKKSQNGATTVGVAAAAKLYFTIVPANMFQAIYYKILSFWNLYQPWTSAVAILIGLIAIVSSFKKYFNIEINRRQGPKKHEKNREKNIEEKNE